MKDAPTVVQYVSEHGTTVEGWVIDSMDSPLTGKFRLLIADSPNDSPEVDGKWVDSDKCWEPPEPHPSQILSCFI